MSLFKGAGVAIVTPMHEDGSVNFESLGNLIENQISRHTDAVVIVGTTGEASTLDDPEHLDAVEYCIQKVNHRIPVIAGTGSNNTAHAIMMTEEVRKRGADGVLLVTPYYNKTTQRGLVAHYTTIAQSTDLPCIVYNVPSRTGVNVLPETMVKICEANENIVAIKEASGNISQIARLASLTEGRLDIYSGNDDQIVPICALGGIGVISVLSNVAPRETHDMVAYCLNGQYDKARALQLKAMPLIAALFSEVNPIPVKAALNMQGFNVGLPRLPLIDMEDDHKALLEKAMKDFGCL